MGLINPLPDMSLEFDPAYEKEFIVRISRGDAAAFHAIYQYYSPRVYGKLLKVLKSKELAADILQDLFSIIWQKRAGIDPEKSFGAYLFRISDNLVIDVFRKARRDQQLITQLMNAGIEEMENTESWLYRKENEAWLNKAIESLPPQRQMVFRLCKLENRSHEEVSRLLNISRATVNNHLVKAIQNLKSLAAGNSDLARFLLLLWLFE